MTTIENNDKIYNTEIGGAHMEESLKTFVHRVDVDGNSFKLYIGYVNPKDIEQDITDEMVENISSIEIPAEGLVGVLKNLVRVGATYQKDNKQDIGFKFIEIPSDGQTKRTRIEF